MMRRMILTTLVLLPMTAFAATSNEPQPSSSSANVSAALKTPAAAASTTTGSAHALVHESVQTTMTDARIGNAGTPGAIEYAFWGGMPTVTTTPSVTRAVEVGLTPAE